MFMLLHGNQPNLNKKRSRTGISVVKGVWKKLIAHITSNFSQESLSEDFYPLLFCLNFQNLIFHNKYFNL